MDEKHRVTIIVVPRERFSLTQRSLESIYAETEDPFKLIYVDGGSPRHIKNWLAEQSREKGFSLIRSNHFLTPNEARNLAIPRLQTDYAVFIDNDVLVKKGWLDALVTCGDDTGAWVVGPLYLMGEFESGIVHMSGGQAHITEQDGYRQFYETQRHYGVRLSEIETQLRREPCEVVEFHCMLVRSEIFGKIGAFDENLKSALENPDFCMLVRRNGGQIYFEPRAVVTYLPPPAVPLRWSDIPYFTVRWGHSWNRANLEHFPLKWNLSADDPTLTAQFSAWEGWRTSALIGSRKNFSKLLGWRLGTLVHRNLSRIERTLNAALTRNRTLDAESSQPRLLDG